VVAALWAYRCPIVTLRPVPNADDARAIHAAHDAFVSGARPDHVRDLVVESWVRSAAAGVNADTDLAPITLEIASLADYRDAHPLTRVFPLLYDVLGQAAEACDSVMAVGDAAGQLLWVCGPPRILMRAEQMNFVEGAAWDEAHAGTNAPGTALRLDSPVQIRGAEHFARAVQRWSCVAAPIHDPETHAVLGVVDLTGGEDIASPQTMAMVRAAARMAEAELGRLNAVGRVHRLIVPAHPGQQRRLVIDGLGRPDCRIDDGVRSICLRPRHSEILTVLVGCPDGLTGEQLAIEIYGDDANLSTVRAELTRLRALLGEDVLDSRPYRLRVSAECDWLTVEAHVVAGRLGEAIRCYRGPLLPQSDAPGVVRRRQRLENQLRSVILASASPDLMIAWTRSRWGADDLEMWERQVHVLPERSPLRSIADAEVRRLQREFGLPALRVVQARR
jgi:GAF domain-containing protein